MCIGMRSGDFRYFNVNSIIHSLNPLCKILALLIFVIMAVIGTNIRVMCSLFIILFFIIGFSNIRFINYVRPLFFIRYLLLFIFIIGILFSGFYSSLIFVSRICLIIMYFCVFLFTTTTNGIVYGFSHILRPFSFLGDVSRFSIRCCFVLNFIPRFFYYFNKTRIAMVSRGSGFRSFFSRFIYSFRRVCSLWNGDMNYSYGTCIKSSRWRIGDFCMISCHLLVLLFVLVKEVVL